MLGTRPHLQIETLQMGAFLPTHWRVNALMCQRTSARNMSWQDVANGSCVSSVAPVHITQCRGIRGKSNKGAMTICMAHQHCHVGDLIFTYFYYHSHACFHKKLFAWVKASRSFRQFLSSMHNDGECLQLKLCSWQVKRQRSDPSASTSAFQLSDQWCTKRRRPNQCFEKCCDGMNYQ